MVCIYCTQATKVNNSRLQKNNNRVWRRRQCLVCEAIFSTHEAVDLGQALLVKRSSSVEPFSRDNLFLSVYDSLKHRKTAIADADSLTQTIINTILDDSSSPTIDLSQIKLSVLRVLRNFDQAGATSYEAFHGSN